MRLQALALLLTLSLFGCEGATGPIGPAGPQGDPGPQGPQGPRGTTRLTFFGQLDGSGLSVASVALPVEAGTLAAPPTISCYISSTSSGPFLLIGTDTGPQLSSCALRQGAPGLEVMLLAQDSQFWHFRVTVVY